MKPQPSYAQAGSIYYICLLRDELLLHQGKAWKYWILEWGDASSNKNPAEDPVYLT